jgi:flagellar operon protein
MVVKIKTPVPLEPGSLATQPKPLDKGFEKQFTEALASTSLKFSNHAMERIARRRISLSESQIDKLHNAIERAEKKGSKESLVLLNDLAMVVSVKNRTVLTAMQTEMMKDSIITNIDSTVIA